MSTFHRSRMVPPGTPGGRTSDVVRGTGRLAICLISCFAPLLAAPTAPNLSAEAEFFRSPAPTTLPADAIYPAGRRLAFMGYSGDPQRDLTRGFTVAGPVYGDQTPYLQTCHEHGWPVVARIGAKLNFQDKSPDKAVIREEPLRAEITRQVQELADRREIVWWSLQPEELRPWRADEMKYLDIVTSAVRAADPLHRPVFLYNPNHRDAKALEPVARRVDLLGKGCYVNSAGKKRDRAWVKWSILQEIEAAAAAGRPGIVPVLMPELCKDPDPAEDREIGAWVRHDIYLGMASGARAVTIWSLFKRAEVRRTWQLWYDAYSRCATELNGPRALAQVFLFGERRSGIVVDPPASANGATITLGGGAEAGTTTTRERESRSVAVDSWTSADIASNGSRFLFLINSANQPATFHIHGWPPGCVAEDAFTGQPAALPVDKALQATLPAYGVAAWRFHPAGRP